MDSDKESRFVLAYAAVFFAFLAITTYMLLMQKMPAADTSTYVSNTVIDLNSWDWLQ